MDLFGVSNTNGNFYDFSSNLQKSDNNNTSYASKIIIVKKGEVGFMKQMDLDDDGEISLEEFNTYCAENGISEEDKIALLTTIQSAKQNSKIIENAKEDEEETTENSSSKAIYAKKGDDKYDEKMDINQDDTITYSEYFEYINKNKQSEINNINNNSQKITGYKEKIEESEPNIELEI